MVSGSKAPECVLSYPSSERFACHILVLSKASKINFPSKPFTSCGRPCLIGCVNLLSSRQAPLVDDELRVILAKFRFSCSCSWDVYARAYALAVSCICNVISCKSAACVCIASATCRCARLRAVSKALMCGGTLLNHVARSGRVRGYSPTVFISAVTKASTKVS